MQVNQLLDPFSLTGVYQYQNDVIKHGERVMLFMLVANKESKGLGFSFVQEVIDYPSLSREEAEEQIIELISNCEVIKNDPIEILRAANVTIPQATRRGCGKRYGDTIAYVGKSPVDAGIFVLQIKDKFAVVPNRNYQNYYRVIDTNG
jgi:hypothetical protein